MKTLYYKIHLEELIQISHILKLFCFFLVWEKLKIMLKYVLIKIKIFFGV